MVNLYVRTYTSGSRCAWWQKTNYIHTNAQNKHCNPCCTCTPRVNMYIYYVITHYFLTNFGTILTYRLLVLFFCCWECLLSVTQKMLVLKREYSHFSLACWFGPLGAPLASTVAMPSILQEILGPVSSLP